MRTLFSYLMQN